MVKQILERLRTKLIRIVWLTQIVVLLSFHAINQIDGKYLKGKWVLTNPNQINYPTLHFETDSTALFTSRADTVYRFTYSLDKDYLLLKNPFGSETAKCKIIKLTNDELTFSNLLEHNKKQVYKRSVKR